MLKSNKLASVITAVIGIIIITFGIILYTETQETTKTFFHDSPYYNVTDASFGADFSTYMYDASDTIVDELDDINNGVTIIVSAQNAQIKAQAKTTETIMKSTAVILIAIGLALVAFSLFNRDTEATDKKAPPKVTAVPQAPSTSRISSSPTYVSPFRQSQDAAGDHKWRCSCGTMIDSYPCPNCGITEVESK